MLLLYLYADLQELVCLFIPATLQRQLPQNSWADDRIFVPFKRNQTLSCYHTYSVTVIPMQAVGNTLFCSLLTYTNRSAWGNALDAVLGQSEEPGVAENSVAESHRMCCRLLLGYTVYRRKRRKMLDAKCQWVCRIRDILLFFF